MQTHNTFTYCGIKERKKKWNFTRGSTVFYCY